MADNDDLKEEIYKFSLSLSVIILKSEFFFQNKQTADNNNKEMTTHTHTQKKRMKRKLIYSLFCL